jgi:hypothetical protein
LKYCQSERRILEHRGEQRDQMLWHLTDNPGAMRRATEMYLHSLYMIDPTLLDPSVRERREALIRIGELNDPAESVNELEDYHCHLCNMEFDCQRKYHLHLTTKNHQAVFHKCQSMCPTCHVPLNWTVSSHLMSEAHCEKRYAVFEDVLFLHTLD